MQLGDWAVPEHSRGRVNAAGATLVDPATSPAARRDGLSMVTNWQTDGRWSMHQGQGGPAPKASKAMQGAPFSPPHHWLSGH